MADEKILSQSEIDELLKTLGEAPPESAVAEEAVEEKKVSIYDFKKPHKLNNQQIAILKNIFESAARSVRGGFQSFLRLSLECKLLAVEELNYEEFLKSLPVPTCIYLLDVRGIHVPMVVEIGPVALFPMIERIFGSTKNVGETTERALTDLEWDVADRVLEKLLSTFAEAVKFDSLKYYNIAVRESNPLYVSVLSATEPLVSVSYEISISGKSGLLSIGVPFEVVHKLIVRASAAATPAPARPRTLDVRSFGMATFDMSCYVADATVPLEDLLHLQEGTTFKFEEKLNDMLFVSIQGIRKFKGELGEIGKNVRAVKIADKAPEFVAQPRVSIENKGAQESSDAINNAEFDVSVEVARRKVLLDDICALAEGDVFKFDKHVESDLKLYVNGVFKGTGKAVKVGDKFGFQFTSLVAHAKKPQ